MNTTEKIEIEGDIIHTSQVEHVTFYLAKDEHGIYRIYTQSKKHGIKSVGANLEEGLPDFYSYDIAMEVFTKEQAKLEEILERKRNGVPTRDQVYFLFSHKITIPLDLTWGQASDIIDEWLTKEKQKKVHRQETLFRGLAIGDRVAYHSNLTKKQYTGIITHLRSNNRGGNYAYVQWENAGNEYFRHTQREEEYIHSHVGESRISVEFLQKIEGGGRKA